jgi:hypothetical protein
MAPTNYETISLALSIIVMRLKQRILKAGFRGHFPGNKNAPGAGAGVIDSLIFNFLSVQIYP